MKQSIREEAIFLRKQGLSYSEILKQVSVAKSTLSLWLRSVGLTNTQKQRLTAKKIAAIKRGGKSRIKDRIEKTIDIQNRAHEEIRKIKIDNNYLWFMGIMLYWAEGSKYKAHNISQGVCFSNQDPFMIRMFLLWLKKCLLINSDQIRFDIYIHENYQSNLESVRKYWAKVTGHSCDKFDKIYYKRHKVNTQRYNIGNNYFGLLRIHVRKSTDLNRKISGWTEEICRRWGVV
jgi:hypothetical protein